MHESWKEFFNLEYLRLITNKYCANKKLNPTEITDVKNLISLCFVGWF